MLEFAPGGSRHGELVTSKPEEDMRAEETSSMVNELPSKIDDFLEVKFCSVRYDSTCYEYKAKHLSSCYDKLWSR